MNNLQEDSWVCFLESQGVSSPRAHLATLSSWAGQLVWGILDSDSHLRSVRGKVRTEAPGRYFSQRGAVPGVGEQ